MMKIKLLVNVPVADEHGLTKDRVMDVLREQRASVRSGAARWFVRGDTGEEVGVLPHEAEEVYDADVGAG
jgi:hypothetical protein